MSPAATPARAGTAAMSGSVAGAVPTLAMLWTPRSRSRYAPAMARRTTKPSRMRRRVEVRRPSRPIHDRDRAARSTAVGSTARTIRTVVASAIADAARMDVRGDPAGTSSDGRRDREDARRGCVTSRPSATDDPMTWDVEAPRPRDSSRLGRRRATTSSTTIASAAIATTIGPTAMTPEEGRGAAPADRPGLHQGQQAAAKGRAAVTAAASPGTCSRAGADRPGVEPRRARLHPFRIHAIPPRVAGGVADREPSRRAAMG